MSAVLTLERQDSASLTGDAGTLEFPVILWSETQAHVVRSVVEDVLPSRSSSPRLLLPLHGDKYGGGAVPVDTQQKVAFLNHERVEQLLARAIRTLYPRGTIKRLARLLDVPIGTAHSLIHKRLSRSRRRELAEKLLKEIYGEIQSHIELCMELEEITGNRNAEMGSAGGAEAGVDGDPGEKSDYADPLMAAARWLAEKARQ